MSPIHYRPIEKKDYDAVAQIICQSFGLAHYVEDPTVLAAFKKQYLYSCLSEATFTCVAEKDNVIIGVIMGKADKRYHFFSHALFILKTLWYSAKMKQLSGKNATGIQDYHAVHKLYRQFSRKHKGEFDGVLTLFAVSEMSRGFGIGKQLWTELSDYLTQCGVKRIYLYTDSTCNTGFYDKQGFLRTEQQPLTIICDKEKFNLQVYLYTKKL